MLNARMLMADWFNTLHYTLYDCYVQQKSTSVWQLISVYNWKPWVLQARFTIYPEIVLSGLCSPSRVDQSCSQVSTCRIICCCCMCTLLSFQPVSSAPTIHLHLTSVFFSSPPAYLSCICVLTTTTL